MELTKNRKVIPCYWETQPSGCLKPYCPFLHSKNEGETSDIKSQAISKQLLLKKTDSCAKNVSQAKWKTFRNPVVKPLVINLEEDSDSESELTQSPVKMPPRITVKTLEEIRLEEVQAESAAYYSYSETNPTFQKSNDSWQYMLKSLNVNEGEQWKDFNNTIGRKEVSRKRKFFPKQLREDEVKETKKRQKLALKKPNKDIAQVKVETLEEIRAEKGKRMAAQTSVSSSSETRTCVNSTKRSSVSITSKTEENKKLQVAEVPPIKWLKRTRSEDSLLNRKKLKASEEEVPEISVEKRKIFECSCDKLEIFQCNNEEVILNNNCRIEE
ncbi:hypothetical protein Trydic_g4185 [Trypoxylus dichotomus]